MDRAERRIGRRIAIAAVALAGAAAMAIWAILPDGTAARIERRADCFDPAAMPEIERLADGRSAMRLRVLLWNVEGLPWPIRSGRAAKLARIADWIAKRRAAGRGSDILMLQEAFTPAASRIAVAGRFDSVVPGPAQDQMRVLDRHPQPVGYADAAHWWQGERIGKWLDGGLYIATDLPVFAVRSEPFGTPGCAGYDCLANKGALAVRVVVPGAPAPLILFTTHRNSLAASGVDDARAEAAHVMQTRENDRLLAAFGAAHADTGAMIAAGDFNHYRAGDRTGAFAKDRNFRLVAKGAGEAARGADMSDREAWARASDLIGFRSSDTLVIEPLAVVSLFDGENGPRLSDHDAQYIVFRLSWRGDAAAMPVAVPRCTAA